ncbi:PepSY domain-containing protein [Nocardioides sp. W7]|uniref:PepSY domain-containing protein n=1 Tax=Nocardioides sp. W7 TaxID=2931390 RepID=UPI001FD20120|nr:PepSY domain-containing protein [Nocardioides sp. W7]
MSTRRSTRSPVLTALLVGPLTLGLVACGDDDGDDRDDAAERSASSTADPSGPASSEPASGPAGDDVVLAAAATAAGAVPGGVLFTLDLEAAGWDAEVVAADGTAHDLTVSADGASVTRDPVVDADDADDLAERQQLLADATVDVAGAVEAARTAVPSGTVTGLDLDLSAGTAVWEVQLDEDTATEQTVTVDAGTGEVLRTERDD